MSETSLFESWWNQNKHFPSAYTSPKEIANKAWQGTRMSAIILLRIERTKPLNMIEEEAIEKCIKVLEDNL